MAVKYNDKDIANWTEYIYTKFSDSSLFGIENQQNGDFIVNSKTNKTKIWFYGLKDEALILHDCQYYNDDCKGWSGETTAANVSEWGTFTQANVDILDDILKTPIDNGWISIDYYLGEAFYKSKMYSDKDINKTPFVYVASNFGCLAIILVPLFWIVGKLIDIGLIGQKKEIIIDGIKNSTH